MVTVAQCRALYNGSDGCGGDDTETVTLWDGGKDEDGNLTSTTVTYFFILSYT